MAKGKRKAASVPSITFPTPPAYPVGRQAPQLSSQLSHHPICQVLETTLMWKGGDNSTLLWWKVQFSKLALHFNIVATQWRTFFIRMQPTWRYHMWKPLLKLLLPVSYQRRWDTIAADSEMTLNQMISTVCLSFRKPDSSQSCPTFNSFTFLNIK